MKSAKLQALLVDDDPVARLALRSVLSDSGDVEVLAEAKNCAETIAAIHKHNPEVVFLDIQMPDGSGLDLVAQLPASVEIIFVTTYESHAVRAFELNALDYLVKPLEPARVAESIRRMRERLDAGKTGRPITRHLPVKPGDNGAGEQDLVYLPLPGGQIFLPAAEIERIESRGNLTKVVTADGRHYLVRRSLDAWQWFLDDESFIRLSRQLLVPRRVIARIEKSPLTESRLQIEFNNGQPPLALSRRRARELKRRWKKSP